MSACLSNCLFMWIKWGNLWITLNKMWISIDLLWIKNNKMWISFTNLLKTLWITSEIIYAKRKTVDNSNKMCITFGHLLKILWIILKAVDKVR